MTLRIVTEKCEFTGVAGKVVLESDKSGPLAIEELQGARARQMAIEFAQTKGLSGAGVNGSLTIYPVDAAGDVVGETATPLKEGDTPTAMKPIVAYRGDVPVTARLV